MLLGDSRRTIHARSPHPISPHPAPLDLTTNPPLTSSRAPTPKTFSTPPRLGYSVVTRHLLPPGYSVFCMRPQAAGLFCCRRRLTPPGYSVVARARASPGLFCCRRRLTPPGYSVVWRHVRPSYSIVARARVLAGLFGCCPGKGLVRAIRLSPGVTVRAIRFSARASMSPGLFGCDREYFKPRARTVRASRSRHRGQQRRGIAPTGRSRPPPFGYGERRPGTQR